MDVRVRIQTITEENIIVNDSEVAFLKGSSDALAVIGNVVDELRLALDPDRYEGFVVKIKEIKIEIDGA